MALNDTRIRALKRSQEVGRYTDSGGLVLDVKPSGALLWRYRYRIGSKENLYAIGAYPEVSLREAREARDDARKLVKQGIHPAHHRKAEVMRHGESVDLSALEFKLLRYFIEHRGAALSRDELLNRVWGYEAMPYSRTVDVHVSGLRQKIEANPSRPQYVITVHRLGYKFVG